MRGGSRRTTVNSNGAQRLAEEGSPKDLLSQRPGLLEEKLKLDARIIDEFNLTLLEKMPRAELVRQANAYVSSYVRRSAIRRSSRSSPRRSSTR